MTLLQVFLVIFVLNLCFSYVQSNFAPKDDKSSTYPEGWCDLRFGKPTRTTGECICFKNCEGKGCVRQQGFIYYAFAECPDCKCVAAVDSPNLSVDKVSSKENNVKVSQNSNEESELSKPRKIVQQSIHIDHSEEEEPFHLMYFIEENWRYVFAGFVSIAVTILIVTALISVMSVSNTTTVSIDKTT